MADDRGRGGRRADLGPAPSLLLQGRAREVQITYRLIGAVERSSSAPGRALARLTALDISYDPALRDRDPHRRRAEVLSLACDPRRAGPRRAPCGTRVTEGEWTVELGRSAGRRPGDGPADPRPGASSRRRLAPIAATPVQQRIIGALRGSPSRRGRSPRPTSRARGRHGRRSRPRSPHRPAVDRTLSRPSVGREQAAGRGHLPGELLGQVVMAPLQQLHHAPGVRPVAASGRRGPSRGRAGRGRRTARRGDHER